MNQMKIPDRALTGIMSGLILIATVFTAVMFRPSFSQLAMFTATLCGIGHSAQVLIRWSWRRIGTRRAASGLALGASICIFALTALHDSAPAILDLLATAMMMLLVAVHIRLCDHDESEGPVRVTRST
jgi:uncharacterized membrane protein YfcA